MKEKILTFVIGFLVGAIIATAGFLLYSKITQGNNVMPMDGNGPMGEQANGMEQPPEKPSGDNGEEPPTKPEEASNTNMNN